MAKKFMFVCFGILALVGAYAVGANNSVAQVGGSDIVQVYNSNSATVVVTANGDFYARNGIMDRGGSSVDSEPIWNGSGPWVFKGNCFSSSVNSQGTTIGDVKSLFR